MRYLIITLLLSLIAFSTKAQTTAIPDANFEQALINQNLDNVLDGQVLTSNIDNISSLEVNSDSISDMTGIEDFVALTSLKLDNNQVTSLDLSNNISLEFLFCRVNQLTNLNLSNNTALKFLFCGRNQLTSLDVTNNTALTQLSCWDNQLTSIGVTNNISLRALACGQNQITYLDLSNNIALRQLACNNNQIANLDVSDNTALEEFVCDQNQLYCLNIKNGNNINFTVFSAISNVNLTCIEVDDVAYSTFNWNNIGLQTSFSTNCNNRCSTLAVGIEENTLSNLSIYPNPNQGNIAVDLGESVSNLKTTLINSLGQVVQTQNYSSTNLVEMNIDAPKGLYFLQIETDNGDVITKKIIKE